MKNIFILIFLILSFKIFACDCDDINPIMEFYSSKYVFEGEAISKIYSKDSLTYDITFNVLKHYKKGNDMPKNFKFNLEAESEYTEIWTSCDWKVEKGERWLIYAYENKGKIIFTGVCSNSRSLDYRPINSNEQKILDNGNKFILKNYIYKYEKGFKNIKLNSNLDSIIRIGKIKNYSKPYTWLELLIDEKGKLCSIGTFNGSYCKHDTIFNLSTEFIIRLKKPLTEFEKDAIELVKKVSKWEIKKHKLTNISVKHIRHLIIEFDSNKKIWKYE